RPGFRRGPVPIHQNVDAGAGKCGQDDDGRHDLPAAARPRRQHTEPPLQLVDLALLVAELVLQRIGTVPSCPRLGALLLRDLQPRPDGVALVSVVHGLSLAYAGGRAPGKCDEPLSQGGPDRVCRPVVSGDFSDAREGPGSTPTAAARFAPRLPELVERE